MKQTAVEWLLQIQLSGNGRLHLTDEEFEKAKEMEKEQILDAYMARINITDKEYFKQIEGGQYYNETFKSESLGLKNCDVTLNNSLKNEPPYVSDDFQIGPDGAYEHTDEENTLTPKEKAIELTHKFYEIKINPMYSTINEYMAKECALIAVDEILKNSVGYNAYDGVTDNDIWADDNYWVKVKQEIEKL